LLVHHQLGAAQRQVQECHEASGVFFDDLLAWHRERSSSNGRVRTPNIVPDTLSGPLTALAAIVKQESQRLDQEGERQDLVAASDRLHVLAGGIRQWLAQQIAD